MNLEDKNSGKRCLNEEQGEIQAWQEHMWRMEEAYVAWELEEDRLERLNAAHVISEVYGIGPIDSTQLVTDHVGFWTYPPLDLENEAAAAAQAAYEEEMESGYGSAESSMDIMNFPEQDVLDNAPFEPNQPGIAPGSC